MDIWQLRPQVHGKKLPRPLPMGNFSGIYLQSLDWTLWAKI